MLFVTSGTLAETPPNPTEIADETTLNCISADKRAAFALIAPGLWYEGRDHDKLMRDYRERRARYLKAESALLVAESEIDILRRRIEFLEFDLETSEKTIEILREQRGGFWSRHFGKTIGPSFVCTFDGDCTGGPLGGTIGFSW